jgi:hypothetical protein
VSRFYAFRENILPKALGGILAIVVLAAGHAFIPRRRCCSPRRGVVKGDIALSSPVMTLPTHLYYLVSEASSSDQAAMLIGCLVDDRQLRCNRAEEQQNGEPSMNAPPAHDSASGWPRPAERHACGGGAKRHNAQ